MPVDDRRPLLPPSATTLERAAAEALAEIQRAPVPLRDLIDPWRCPVHLLPYLAWTCSVDKWDPAWPEATKRKVIADSFYVHSRKGTLGALKRVVEPWGYVIEIIEWWQQDPPGPSGTFDIRIGIDEQGIDEQTYRELERLLDDAKPLTRGLTGLSVEISTDAAEHVGVTVTDGDVLDVYPWLDDEIEVTAQQYQSAVTVGSTDVLEVAING